MEDLRLPSPFAEQTSALSGSEVPNEAGITAATATGDGEEERSASINRSRTPSGQLDPEKDNTKTICRLLARVNFLEKQLNNYKHQNGEKPIETETPPASSPSIQYQSQSPTDRRTSSTSGSLASKASIPRPRRVSTSNFRASRTSQSIPSPKLHPETPPAKDNDEGSSSSSDEEQEVQGHLDGNANRGIPVAE